MENINLVELVHQARILDYLHIFAASFFYYDYALTLAEEIDCLWLQPKSLNSAWFYFNRYFTFFLNIPVLVFFFIPLSKQKCQLSLLFHQMVLLVTQLVICAILTLRVYALYLCDKRVLWSLISCAVVLVAVAAWSLVGQKNVSLDDVPGCHLGVAHNTAMRVATPWEALFVYDSLLFGATMLKTFRHRREQLPGGRSSLVFLMFRDGAIYYGVMILANLANILTFYKAGPILRGCLSTFSSSVSVTMVSRLLLNLHLHQSTSNSSISLSPHDDNIELRIHIS